MAEKTTISWTTHTWNVGWGCCKVSPGCKRCYAEILAHRYGFDVWGLNNPRRTFGEAHWREPLKWNRAAEREGRRHRVFCSSMCDVFENHPTIIQKTTKLWPLIRQTPWLHWQLLTKRSNRIATNLPSDWSVANYPNVWLGVSIENNDYVQRADDLRKIPAAVRFISAEPLLGPLDRLNLEGIHWVIVGGESGCHFRAMDIRWARDLQQRCEEAQIAFFFKQSAGRRPSHDPHIDGMEVKEFPVRRISLPVLGR